MQLVVNDLLCRSSIVAVSPVWIQNSPPTLCACYTAIYRGTTTTPLPPHTPVTSWAYNHSVEVFQQSELLSFRSWADCSQSLPLGLIWSPRMRHRRRRSSLRHCNATAMPAAAELSFNLVWLRPMVSLHFADYDTEQNVRDQCQRLRDSQRWRDIFTEISVSMQLLWPEDPLPCCGGSGCGTVTVPIQPEVQYRANVAEVGYESTPDYIECCSNGHNRPWWFYWAWHALSSVFLLSSVYRIRFAKRCLYSSAVVRKFVSTNESCCVEESRPLHNDETIAPSTLYSVFQ
eukprot:Lankesteria_metandrocarpae@DN3181_c0_g1_i4.p1